MSLSPFSADSLVTTMSRPTQLFARLRRDSKFKASLGSLVRPYLKIEHKKTAGDIVY